MKGSPSRTSFPGLGVCLLALVAICGPAVAGDSDETQPEAKSAVEVYFHKNGSVTITVDGQKHLLSPRQYRKQAESLLKGKQQAVIQMEDWNDFERLPSDTGRMFYKAGVRTLTLKPVVNGREETRTLSPIQD